MSERNDGGQAFPREDYHTDCAGGQRGMTMRDYFAVHATDDDVKAALIIGEAFTDAYDRALARFRHADAMLKAREGKV